MNYSDPQQLERIIEKLGNLLTEGHLKYRTQRQNYFQQKDKPSFKVENHIQETKAILDEWFKVVVKFLEKNVKETHHLFHFLQHHGGSLKSKAYLATR